MFFLFLKRKFIALYELCIDPCNRIIILAAEINDKENTTIYVASKYAGNVDANVAAAIGYCKYVISQN